MTSEGCAQTGEVMVVNDPNSSVEAVITHMKFHCICGNSDIVLVLVVVVLFDV